MKRSGALAACPLQHCARKGGAPRRLFAFDAGVAGFAKVAKDFRGILLARNFAHAEFGPRGCEPRWLIHTFFAFFEISVSAGRTPLPVEGRGIQLAKRWPRAARPGRR